jgi:hypothetical protein
MKYSMLIGIKESVKVIYKVWHWGIYVIKITSIRDSRPERQQLQLQLLLVGKQCDHNIDNLNHNNEK